MHFKLTDRFVIIDSAVTPTFQYTLYTPYKIQNTEISPEILTDSGLSCCVCVCVCVRERERKRERERERGGVFRALINSLVC